MPTPEFVFLRWCLSLPKIMYILRTVEYTRCEKWDEVNDINRLMEGLIEGEQHSQAQLPGFLVGAGLQADHVPLSVS